MGAENLMVKNAVSSWKQTVAQVDKTIAGFGDEELQREVAPGRNRLYYLLGHLTAVHDRMFATLRLGNRLHSELDEEFIVKADKTDLDDEVPALLPPEYRKRCVGGMEGAEIVDLDDLPHLLRRDGIDRPGEAVAGVADHHVEPPEAVDRLGDEPLHVLVPRDVRDDR